MHLNYLPTGDARNKKLKSSLQFTETIYLFALYFSSSLSVWVWNCTNTSYSLPTHFLCLLYAMTSPTKCYKSCVSKFNEKRTEVAKHAAAADQLFKSSLSQNSVTVNALRFAASDGQLGLRCGHAWIPRRVGCHRRLAISQAAKCYFPIVFLFATVWNCNLCDFTVSLCGNLQSARVPKQNRRFIYGPAS